MKELTYIKWTLRYPRISLYMVDFNVELLKWCYFFFIFNYCKVNLYFRLILSTRYDLSNKTLGRMDYPKKTW